MNIDITMPNWPSMPPTPHRVRTSSSTALATSGTIHSEDSDGFIMGCNGLLKALAIVARGVPFASLDVVERGMCQMTSNTGLVSGKARLHACIAIMNLSCGKANKIETAWINEVLNSMRAIMVAKPAHFAPAKSSPAMNGTATHGSVSEEARLKAATCVQKLSNTDANDAALLDAPTVL